jgi:Zn-finger nucleic acid-binding protein
MICLRCESDTQKTIFEGVLIDYCSECQSFWLDGEELEVAVENGKFDSEILCKEVDIEKLPRDIVFHHDNICPKCVSTNFRKMERYGIQLNQCWNCKGIFFDRDELQKCINSEKKDTWVYHLWDHVKSMF